MISRSRLWSNFLHWQTNQLLSFHKFPRKIIASGCSNSYPQGRRAVTVWLSVTFDFAPKAATHSAYKPSIISAICSSGRTTLTHHQYGGYHLQRYPFRAWYTYRFKSSDPQQLVWLVGTPGDDVFRWWCRCHLKHKPNFSYNYHCSLTVDSSRFHTMSVIVFLSLHEFSHVLSPEPLRFVWIWLGFLEQPKAITLTWLSVSANHLANR